MTYKEYENSDKFSIEQLDEICIGFINGLSQEQIELYAKPEFNNLQMYEIYQGFKNGLSREQIKLYAKPKFNWSQMRQIRFGLENGLLQQQVKFYAKHKFDGSQMYQIRFGFQQKFSQEKINLYANSKFSHKQMYQIRFGLENGLSQEQVELYARPEIAPKQMERICQFILEANDKQIQQIKESIEVGLSYNQFCAYLDKNIHAENMRMYKSLYEMKYTNKDISWLIRNKTPYFTLKEIKSTAQYINYFKLKKIQIGSFTTNPTEVIDSLADAVCKKSNIMGVSCFDVIRRCLAYKMPPEQIKFIANPKFNSEQIKQIAIAFLNELDIDDIKSVVNYKDSADIIKTNIDALIKDKFYTNNSINEENVPFKFNWFNDIDSDFCI